MKPRLFWCFVVKQSGIGAEELVSYTYVHSSHLYILSSKEKVVDHATPDFYKDKCKINRFFNDGLNGWLLPAGQGSDNACHMFPHLFLCVATKWRDDDNKGFDKRVTGVFV